MFTEQELHTIKIYEEEGIRKEIDDSPLDLDPFAARTFARMRSKGRVLDIGCGHGRVVPVIADMGIEKEFYKGVDPSPAQISLAKDIYPDLNFEVGNIYQIGDAYPAHFDGFWCCMMLMHVPRDKVVQALKSLRKSLRVNAVGIIATPCGAGTKRDEEGMEITLYDEAELKIFLERAGFRSSSYRPISQPCVFDIQVVSVVAV